MIPTLTIILFLGVLTFIIVMLLPAIIELKKPKDAGPRIILENTFYLQNLGVSLDIPSLEVDEPIEVNQKIVKKIVKVLTVLPRLEV
ncbi:MAG: hypothetical protein QXR63_04290 [Candidatus Bathyarchaeia archaeon]